MRSLESEFSKAYFWEKYRILCYLSSASKLFQIRVLSLEIYLKYETSRRQAREIGFWPKLWTQPTLNLILISKPSWKLKLIDNISHWIITHWLILVIGWDLVTLTVFKGFFHIQKPHKSEISDPLISILSLFLSLSFSLIKFKFP